MALHRAQAEGEVHIPNNWTFETESARAAATGFLASEQGKLAFVLSSGTYWRLQDFAARTWTPVGGGGAVVLTPASAADNTIQASGNFPGVTLKGAAAQPNSTSISEWVRSDGVLLGSVGLNPTGGGLFTLNAVPLGGAESTPVLKVMVAGGLDGSDPAVPLAMLSYGGYFYCARLGATDLATGSNYIHIRFLPGQGQLFSFDTTHLSGSGITFHSPDDSAVISLVCNANGSMVFQTSSAPDAPIVARANSWSANRRVFQTETPGGGLRSYFGGFGNLVIHPNSNNGGTGWDTTVPLLVDTETKTAFTANLAEFRLDGTLQAAVHPDGTVAAAGPFVTSRNTAPADGDLVAGQMAVWFDSTAGASALKIKAKNAAGAIVTGSVPLT